MKKLVDCSFVNRGGLNGSNRVLGGYDNIIRKGP